MAQFEITGEAPPPMSVKRPAWGVYDIFDTEDGKLFVGVVTDTQWDVFCRAFGLEELLQDERLKTNGMRVKERGWLIPRINEITRRHTKKSLAAKLESIGLPFAPIAKPWISSTTPTSRPRAGCSRPGSTPKPFTCPRCRSSPAEALKASADPPRGASTAGLLAELGCSPQEIESLRERRIVALS